MKIKYSIYLFTFGVMVVSVLLLNNISFAKNEKILDDFVSGEVIVKLKGRDKPRVMKLRVGKSVREAQAEFEGNIAVEYAEPNYWVYKSFVPNDPLYTFQWHLDNTVSGGVNMQNAWDVATGAGVVVAVVDTGVAYENLGKFKLAPDLASTVFVPGYDFVNNDTHANDDDGHGTHVAGTIAQSTNNAMGTVGVAFGASIMPIKVLNQNGSGTMADVAAGVRFAADNGAKIINLSLGSSAFSLTLKDAVAYAYGKGVTIIAAAGNDSTAAPSYPAAFDDYVISVGATRYDETLAYYSNFGSSVDVVAPGGDVNVDQNGDGYGDGILQQTFGRKPDQFGYYFFQGTSMASPHVAGVAALLSSYGITEPANIRMVLESTAKDLGVVGRDDTFGFGLIDAAAALNVTADALPIVTLISPLDGAVVSGMLAINATATDDVAVMRVDFYANGVLLGFSSISPYSLMWDSTTVADGVYTLTVTAIDSVAQQNSASMNVLVDNVNDMPIADAGVDTTVVDGDDSGAELALLNGSASYDPDGTIVSYEWKEGAVVLGNTAVLNSSFSVGVHNVSLTVIDNRGALASDVVVVTVKPKPTIVVDMAVTRFDARNIKDSSYNIRAQIKNMGSVTTQVTAQVVIYDATGTIALDDTLADRVVSILAGGKASLRWNDVTTLASGNYLAKLTILEDSSATAQNTFTIK